MMTALDRRKLTILQHNVQSWKTNKNSLTNIYNTIDPDIMLLNETSIKDNDRLKIFNYNVFTTNKQNELHAGAAIAIKNTIQARTDDDFFQDFVTATIQTIHGPITIATGYIPPRQQYINSIDLHKIFSRDHPVYLAGDLNTFHRNFGYQNNSTRGKQIVTLIDLDKCRHIGPFFDTRLTANTRRKPDIVLTNNKAHMNTYLKPGPITPSDHIPIILTISTDPIQIPINPRLQFSKTDWTQYKEILTDFHPTDLIHESKRDIDTHIKTWTDKINNATKLTTPVLQFRTIPGIHPNHFIKKLQNMHTKLMTIIATHGTNHDRHRLLTTLRSNLRDEYNRLHQKTWDTIISKIDIDGNPKTFFNAIKRMTGNSTTLSPYIVHNDEKLYDQKEQEPIFRDFWKNIFTTNDPDENNFNHDFIRNIEDRLEDIIDLTTPYITSDLNRLHNNDCTPITITEVTDIIKSLKPKAPGPNEITAQQLKHLPENMRQYLTDIFNHSLSKGYFPDKYKEAIMIMIPKTGGTQVKDKRPISLLNVDGKIYDKLLNRRLTTYLEDNDLQNTRQHGFRRNRGTQTAIMTLHENISKHLGQKHKVDIVCRDVTKAFDKIWHIGLKHKLTESGLHDCMTKTLCNYLTDRTARIRLKHHTGPPFTLDSGVPQGACLSPTLFNFYVQKLPQPLPDTDYIQYADDITQLIALPGPPPVIANNTTHAIKQINSYENNWKIQTNMNKFKVMNISRLKTSPIIINNTQLNYTNNATILGLTYSTTGLSPQVTTRRAIASKTLCKLQRFRNLSTHNKRRLYLTIVRPQLLYPIIPLNTISQASIRKLQQIQNKALRFIENTRLIDKIPTSLLHERNRLPAVNIYLHERSKDIWSKLRDKNPHIYNNIKPRPNDQQRNSRFPTSFKINNTPNPLPLYV